MTAGEFIRIFMERTNLTLDDVSDILGYSGHQTVRNKINRNSLSFDEFNKLIKAVDGTITIDIPEKQIVKIVKESTINII